MAILRPTVFARAQQLAPQIAGTALSGGASRTLQTMFTNTLLSPVMSDDHAQELTQAGFVQQALGGLMLTDMGAFRGIMETET